MGDAVDARGEDTAGLAEGFEFKAGCWGEEELDPRAFLAYIARWAHVGFREGVECRLCI